MSKKDPKYYVHPTAIVEDDVTIGEGTRIWHFAHVRKGAKIGNNCNIGKGVYIDANVKIGNNVKIQNFVSVYHGVTIEDDVFVGPHATFTNDLYPRAHLKDWELVETLVKKGASIGANSTIVCGITIEENAMIAAGATVTKNVPAHALVAGTPSRVIGIVCTCGKKLTDAMPDWTSGVVHFKCSHCGRTINMSL